MGIFIDDKEHDLLKAIKFGRVIGILLVLSLVWGAWFTVGNGEEAVVFSATSGLRHESLGPGIHAKWPWVEDAIKFNVQGQLYETPAAAASKDLQEVQTHVAVRFHADPTWVWWLHQNYGRDNYAGRIIPPGVQENVKACTARYNADQLIEQRPAVKDCIASGLRERLDAVHVVLEDISITNFDFSAQFNAAIEAKVTAQQRALEEKNKLDQVTYQAQQQVIQAQAQANATRLSAEAQADAARAISQQLDQNPRYVEYLMAQKWNGQLPTSYVGDGNFTALLSVSGRTP